jgi:hypothetical protein
MVATCESPLRLIDDDLAQLLQYEPGSYHKVKTLAQADGVLFRCPCGTGHGIIVWFADRSRVPASATPTTRWKASGTALADLTLSPSVDAGCWHGFVNNGVAA